MQPQYQHTYDGRRMRFFTYRRAIDYTSSVMYSTYETKPLSLDYYITPNLAHTSVNKTKCTINAITFTPEGRRLISGTSTGELTLWNSFSFNFETILQAHESSIRSICWSPNDKFLLTGDALGQIKYWDISMSNLQVIKAHEESLREISFGAFAYKFCSCGDDSNIKIFDSKSAMEERTLKGHGWDVRTVKWHPTKALIASGGKDATIRLWDPRAPDHLTLHAHKSTVYTACWADDFLITGSKDQSINIIDIRTMKITNINTGKDITCVVKHPHIPALFVAGTQTGDLLYYKIFDNKPTVVKAHDNAIWTMSYHPMGHLLATGSYDQTVKWWGRKNYRDLDDYLIEDEEIVPGLDYDN